MRSGLIRLVPPSGGEARPLQGCYLGLGLEQGGPAGEPLIYANFITSLDGRIAVADAAGAMRVPEAIANPRDWRLYQELAAQSAVMIVSARYFRQLAAGQAQALLPLEAEELRAWRRARGLPEQPELLLLSRSLDIPLEALAPFADRRITLFVPSEGGAQHRLAALERVGVRLLVAKRGGVSGREVRDWMRRRGLKSGYAIAGCGVFHTLLADGVVDRLFLTTRLALLGGDCVATLLRDALPAPLELSLRTLYYDPAGNQLFADYAIGSNGSGA